MKTAFITRSTLFNTPGGDTIQVLETARHLRKLGIEVDVLLTTGPVDYNAYDLFHYINIIRPSDILYHIHKTKKPFVVSPILVDYSEYDRTHRKGFSGALLRQFSPHRNEYIKTFARWLSRKDALQSKSYLWKGQYNSIREILDRAAMLLPNSEIEYKRLKQLYKVEKDYRVAYMGIDTSLFAPDESVQKDDNLVICAARIEGIKNQLHLIKALNDTRYTLLLVGAPSPNQAEYFKTCKKIASQNIIFRDHISQNKLIDYYKQAKVHALPSWFETCGLSSLEAAAMGCNITISDKGYTREYFGNDAFYCDPADPESIYAAVETASRASTTISLQQKIIENYTWQRAAEITAAAYQKTISV